MSEVFVVEVCSDPTSGDYAPKAVFFNKQSAQEYMKFLHTQITDMTTIMMYSVPEKQMFL